MAAGRTAPGAIEFVEPNLSFELVGRGAGIRLRVWFELEVRPSWAPWKEVPQRDLCVELEVSGDELRAAGDSLRNQLERFPPRATAD